MTTTVEARGVLCPVPIIRLARAAALLPAGSLVELLTDDAAAIHDVPAWCRLRGHDLLESRPADELGPEPGQLAPDLVAPGQLAPDFVAPDRLPVAGPEPHAPNPRPGQAVRHLIRLNGPSPEAARAAP